MTRVLTCPNCKGKWFKEEMIFMINPDRYYPELTGGQIVSADNISTLKRLQSCVSCGHSIELYEFSNLPIGEKEKLIVDMEEERDSLRKKLAELYR